MSEQTCNLLCEDGLSRPFKFVPFIDGTLPTSNITFPYSSNYSVFVAPPACPRQCHNYQCIDWATG